MVTFRPYQCDLSRAQRQHNLAGGPARIGGQINCLAAQFGDVLHAAIQRATIFQNAIMMGADQQLGLGGPAGEFLINIAFPVGDDGDADRSGRDQAGRCICRIKPAAALFLGEGPFFAQMLLAADVAEEYRINKAEQCAIVGVYRDHWMQVQTALLAIVAQGRGVLDRQDVTSLD